jgi:preprotein translocase subunit SecD
MRSCQPVAPAGGWHLSEYWRQCDYIMKRHRTLIVILVVLAIALYLNWPNHPGINFLGFTRGIETHLGLDLVGGVQVLLEADLPQTDTISTEAMQTAVSIVENRVNGLGVSEAMVQRVGARRIVVELPGIKDPEQAIATVKSTGLLEFLDMSSLTSQEAINLVGQTITTDFGTGSVVASTTLTSTGVLTETIWHTVLTGAELENALVTTDQVGKYQISLTFTKDGATKFATYTGDHVGDILAISLDKVVITVPSISNQITDGQAVITGSFTYEEANQLAVQLRYGSLPVPLKIVETRTIGPSLGRDSLQKSMIAGIVGAILVMLFMGLYYRFPGLVADVVLIIYALVTFALYRYIPVTLTLPGIAGFLLSTGSALDANILIFERMKEELRGGRTLLQAIDQGWQRAWPSIRDSNIATLITCVILAIFGSQSGATIVIGFAFTLAVGVAVSLFTALTVTRTFLNLAVGVFKPKNLVRWFGI